MKTTDEKKKEKKRKRKKIPEAGVLVSEEKRGERKKKKKTRKKRKRKKDQPCANRSESGADRPVFPTTVPHQLHCLSLSMIVNSITFFPPPPPSSPPAGPFPPFPLQTTLSRSHIGLRGPRPPCLRCLEVEIVPYSSISSATFLQPYPPPPSRPPGPITSLPPPHHPPPPLIHPRPPPNCPALCSLEKREGDDWDFVLFCFLF